MSDKKHPDKPKGSKSPSKPKKSERPEGGKKPRSGPAKDAGKSRETARPKPPTPKTQKKGGEGEKEFKSRKPYDTRHGAVKFERDATTPSFKSKYQKGPAARKPYKGKPGSQDFGTRNDGKISDDSIRLNKYLANSGLSSRREADELIKSGMVEVNGKVVTEMGVKVKPGDVVSYAGEKVRPQKPVYVLMNKPKDYITTAKDPQNRQTVMHLLKGLGDHRVFPVGRLDRNTTGLLLFTNDGDMAKKLTHPKHGVKKLYHVHLDKNCKPEHMHQLVEGVELEDGMMAVDVVSYVADAKDKSQVGVEIHSGKNRIVRRLFESLGYKVVKLDRVVFGGLTKKDLPRGKWRHLTQQELNNLKML